MLVLDSKLPAADRLAFWADGRTLAAATDPDSPVVAFLHLDRGRKPYHVHKYQDAGADPPFVPSPDGRHLIVADGCDLAAVDPAGREVWRRSFPSSHRGGVAVHPNGRLATVALHQTATDDGCAIWASADAVPAAAPAVAVPGTIHYTARAVAFAPDGESVLVAEEAYKGPDLALVSRFRRVGMGGPVGRPIPNPLPMVDQLAIDPVNGHVAARYRNQLAVWPGGAIRKPPVLPKTPKRTWLTGIAFHPSGRRLAVALKDSAVRLYDTTTWTETAAFDWGVGKLRSVAFSADGSLAAVGSESGHIAVWGWEDA